MRNSLFKALNPQLLALTLIASFFTCLSGCEDSDLSDHQIDKIDFQLIVLDHDQNESTTFNAGEDIQIALKIINNSENPIEWRHDYTCLLFQSKDFLLVRKLNEGNETAAEFQNVGTPYQPPINCPTLNLPPDIISPGEKILIRLPWSSNANNQPLAAGQYFTTAEYELNINNQTKSWTLRNDFKMK